MARWIALAAVVLLAGCGSDIDVNEKGKGRYELLIDNDFATRVQGGERMLGKRADELCPDGYQRLKRKSIHKKHGVTEFLLWEIQCA